jgi:hypothetical protein
MALKEALMVKTKMGSDTLTLEAGVGEAFLIKEVNIDNLANVEFAKLSIDRVTVGYLSVYDDKQNQFGFAREKTAFKNLSGYLFDKDIFKGYPVKEGEIFTLDITGATNNNSRVICTSIMARTQQKLPSTVTVTLTSALIPPSSRIFHSGRSYQLKRRLKSLACWLEHIVKASISATSAGTSNFRRGEQYFSMKTGRGFIVLTE